MKKQNKPIYNIVRNKPVAKFYYQGDHSHPVRRTVLIIHNDKKTITGYEFREGSLIRSTDDALSTIKTYRKDRIARWGDYSRLRQSYKTVFKNPNESTLERLSIAEFLSNSN